MHDFTPKVEPSSVINTIRGKAIVNAASPEDVVTLIKHIDALEEYLDKYEVEDTFGTEGWRYDIGLED